MNLNRKQLTQSATPSSASCLCRIYQAWGIYTYLIQTTSPTINAIWKGSQESKGLLIGRLSISTTINKLSITDIEMTSIYEIQLLVYISISKERNHSNVNGGNWKAFCFKCFGLSFMACGCILCFSVVNPIRLLNFSSVRKARWALDMFTLSGMNYANVKEEIIDN